MKWSHTTEGRRFLSPGDAGSSPTQGQGSGGTHLPRDPISTSPSSSPGFLRSLPIAPKALSSCSRQEQRFVPFSSKINRGKGTNGRASSERVTLPGKAGVWQTNTSSNIAACRARLGETGEIPTRVGRAVGNPLTAFCWLIITFFIFYLFPQKKQVIITQSFPHTTLEDLSIII